MTDEEKRARAAEARRRYNEKNADAIKAARKSKYAANKEAAKAAVIEWRSANREAHKAAVKRYRARNPDIKRAEKAKRRAKKREVGGSYTKADVKRLFDAQRGLCACCKTTLLRYEVDHVMPLALGGSNDAENLQLLCGPCNRKKGALHPEVFAAMQGVAA